MWLGRKRNGPACGWGESVMDLNNPTLTFEEQTTRNLDCVQVNLFPILSAPWHPGPSPGARVLPGAAGTVAGLFLAKRDPLFR